jgi:hypothetical protein
VSDRGGTRAVTTAQGFSYKEVYTSFLYLLLSLPVDYTQFDIGIIVYLLLFVQLL